MFDFDPRKELALKPARPRGDKPRTSRMEWVPFATVISCLAVIFLHVNNCFWDGKIHAPYFISANIIECVFYFAVPVFVMVSGATLLDFYKRYGLGTYFKKRVLKTVIPYVAWSLLSVVIYVLRGKTNPASVDFFYILKGLSAGNLLSIYGFFMTLFCVYLSIPLFAAVEEKHRRSVFTFLAVAGFILNTLMPYLKARLHWDINFSLSVGVVSGYLFFVPVGYLISHYKMHVSIRLLVYLIGIGGLLTHILGTYQLSMEANKLVTSLKGYTNLPCIVYSVAMFTFFRYGGDVIMKFRPVKKSFGFLSGFTFSIYLIHQHLIYIFIDWWRIDRTLLVYRLLFPFYLFALIVLIVAGLRYLLPPSKYILPA